MWHVSSRSSVATLRTAIHLLLTYTCTPGQHQQPAAMDQITPQILTLWSHCEETRELPGERENARNNARRRGRPRMAWMDNIKTWTGLTVEESVRMTEDRDKWRKYVRKSLSQELELVGISLHLAPDRQPCQHPINQFLQAGCPSCHATNSVKALKAQ